MFTRLSQFHDVAPRNDKRRVHIADQVFTSSGARLGSERIATITGNSIEARQDVVALADGGFLIAGSNGRTGGSSSYNIYGS